MILIKFLNMCLSFCNMDAEVYKGNIKKYQTKNPILKLMMKKFNRDVTTIVSLCDPKKILDVGCGEGFTTIAMAKKFYKAKITAVDIDVEKIKYAKERNNFKNIHYIKGDVFKLSFNKNSFDLVICTEFLEHLKSYRLVLDILINLSREYILISAPNEPWYRMANIIRLKYVSRLGNTHGHVNNWTKDQLLKLLSQYGKVIKLTRSTLWNIAFIKK